MSYTGGRGSQLVLQEPQMLAQHVTASIGKDLIGKTNETDLSDPEMSRAKRQIKSALG